MSIAEIHDLKQYCFDIACRAKAASAKLAMLSGEAKYSWLNHSAELLRTHTADMIAANAEDIAAAPKYGLNDAQIDRLKLDQARIVAIAAGLADVVSLPARVGERLESTMHP